MRQARARIDRLVHTALEREVFSGASLLLARPETVLFEKTWGSHAFGGSRLREDSLFDLASLTKPLVTVPLCMLAISEGRLTLDDTLERFFPTRTLTPPMRRISVRHLLSHRSGFPAYVPFYQTLVTSPPLERRAQLLSRILSTPLSAPPGERPEYSDLGFMLLGFILEETFGEPLDSLFATRMGIPLRIETLCFQRIRSDSDPARPPVSADVPFSFVATQICPWRQRLLVGEVDDENAHVLGGVAGHAGLFGTARGIFVLLRALWRVYKGAEPPATPPISRGLLRSFWSRQGTLPEDTWALGFDTPSPHHSSAGSRFSSHSVGHLGFTGVSFWMDLDRDFLVILLTNRVHPSRQDDRIRPFRPALHDAAGEYFDALSEC